MLLKRTAKGPRIQPLLPRRGTRTDQENVTLPSSVRVGRSYKAVPNIDHNRVNIPPLKTRRRELRNEPTPAEKLLWKNLQRRQLLNQKFRRQYSVGPYILDFFCPECSLAIELDGAGHYGAAGRLREDYETTRTKFLESFGIEILRFENQTVHQNLEGVLETIRDAVRKRCLTSPRRAES